LFNNPISRLLVELTLKVLASNAIDDSRPMLIAEDGFFWAKDRHFYSYPAGSICRRGVVICSP